MSDDAVKEAKDAATEAAKEVAKETKEAAEAVKEAFKEAVKEAAKKPVWITSFELALGAILALTGVFTGFTAYTLNHSVAKFDQVLKNREQNRQETADLTNVRFRVYDAVTSSIGSEPNAADRQRLAKTLVLSMLSPTDELRDGLLSILVSEGVPDVRKQATEARSEATEFMSYEPDLTMVPQPSSDATWKSYRIDVFWCKNKDNKEDAIQKRNNEEATKVQDRLETAGGKKGFVRLRPLPHSINESPGYRIEGIVIRRDQNEDTVALAVKTEADRALGGAVPGFVLTSSRQGTAGYLSVFVCRK